MNTAFLTLLTPNGNDVPDLCCATLQSDHVSDWLLDSGYFQWEMTVSMAKFQQKRSSTEVDSIVGYVASSKCLTNNVPV
jgi:hypothetical protein